MGKSLEHQGLSELCPNLPESVDHLGIAQLHVLVQQVDMA